MAIHLRTHISGVLSWRAIVRKPTPKVVTLTLRSEEADSEIAFDIGTEQAIQLAQQIFLVAAPGDIPMSEYISMTEIALLAQVRYQTVLHWAEKRSITTAITSTGEEESMAFPAPVHEFTHGKLFNRAEVLQWLKLRSITKQREGRR